MTERSNPATRWADVTPNDSADLTPACRGLYAHGAGDITIAGSDGVAKAFTFAAGEIKPLAATRVYSTGTTATGIRALY